MLQTSSGRQHKLEHAHLRVGKQLSASKFQWTRLIMRSLGIKGEVHDTEYRKLPDTPEIQ
jgi:hypothetical protein